MADLLIRQSNVKRVCFLHPLEPAAPDVSIVIVNWNGGSYLSNCLESLTRQEFRGTIEIILVDNGSTDGSLEEAEAALPHALILRNGSNLGFARAQNLGIARARGRYVMPLNFDVSPTPTFLAEMVLASEVSPEVGIVSGKLLRPEMDEQGLERLDSTGIILRDYFPIPRGESEPDDGRFNIAGPIFGACGAAPLYRREMLEDIRLGREYFDESYYQYVEDVDLSWRAMLRGWRCVYTHRAVAYHKRGVSREARTDIQMGYLVGGWRNRYLTMVKNMTGAEWRQGWRRILGKEWRFLRDCGRRRRLGILWRALAGALWKLPTAIVRRFRIQSRAQVNLKDVRRFTAPWLRLPGGRGNGKAQE